MPKYRIELDVRRQGIIVEAPSEVDALIEIEERLTELVDWQAMEVTEGESNEETTQAK